MRGQLGGLITLLNLRLDFLVLGALAGPAVLGTYAVASKYAELVRLPGTALTWVTYPRMAALTASRGGRARPPAAAARPGRSSRWRWCRSSCSPDPCSGCSTAPPSTPAVRPAQVLLVGMLLSGASGVASGYLYGRGRPGLNSLGLGLGLVATVALDLALIPPYGALGAAVASSAAYLLGDAVLVFFVLRRAAARSRDRGAAPAAVDQAAVVHRLRRATLAARSSSPPWSHAGGAVHRPAGGADARPDRPAAPTSGRRSAARSVTRRDLAATSRPLPPGGRAAARPRRAGLVRDRPGRPVARRADHVPARRRTRMAELARFPGTVGFKVADELGYHDGLTTKAQVLAFLRATRSALARVAPHAQVLVDAVVPELGCLPRPRRARRSLRPQRPRHQPGASSTRCPGTSGRAGRPARPECRAAVRVGLPRSRPDPPPGADRKVWRDVDALGWSAMTWLQARKALAMDGGWTGTHAAASRAGSSTSTSRGSMAPTPSTSGPGGRRTTAAPTACSHPTSGRTRSGTSCWPGPRRGGPVHAPDAQHPVDRAPRRAHEYDLVASVFDAVFVAAGPI